MFGFHPANLAFRLVLELSALVALAVGAAALADGLLGWCLAVAVPLLAAGAWGTFNVPGDESRSGRTPVAVSGPVRLTVELTVFAGGVALLSVVSPAFATVLGISVAIHYLLSVDRVRWLLTR